MAETDTYSLCYFKSSSRRYEEKEKTAMIFDNIEFSNAEEIEKTESGYLPRRIRKEVSGK